MELSEKSERILTHIGWYSFLGGVVFLLLRLYLHLFAGADFLSVLNIVFGIALAVFAFCVFVMWETQLCSDLPYLAFGGIVCPLFFLSTLLSLFLIVPMLHPRILERNGPESMVVVEKAYWFNPFTEKTFFYDMVGYAQLDSISVSFEYAGTMLEFHRAYRDNEQAFDSAGAVEVTAIIEKSTKEFLGQPRIRQLCYLFDELPGVLPYPFVFKGGINVTEYASLKGPVVDLSITD